MLMLSSVRFYKLLSELLARLVMADKGTFLLRDQKLLHLAFESGTIALKGYLKAGH